MESKLVISTYEESVHVLGFTKMAFLLRAGIINKIRKTLAQRVMLASNFYDPIRLVASFTVGARLNLKDIQSVN